MSAGGRCPGSNTQFWGPEDIFEIPCSGCGRILEFFKDDGKRVCPACRQVNFNPRADFFCARWCPSAKDCLGPERYSQLMETEKLELARKEDMERLLNTIPEEDQAIKDLFRKLYLKNSNPAQLFDTRELQALEYRRPELYKKAISYFLQAFPKENQ